MNQKDIRKQCEQIWARNKYYVLSKSHKVYLEIREYLKNNPQKRPLKEIAEELDISLVTLKKNYSKIKLQFS